MAEKTLKTRIIQKHDTEANWLLATNFTPMNGEIIIYDEDDNYNYKRIKVGNGIDNVNVLDFYTGDWNDLKNKPKYKEETLRTIFQETDIEINEDLCTDIGTLMNFKENETYFITLNDILYECKAWKNEEDPYIYIGNGALIEQPEKGDNVPFLLDCYYQNFLVVAEPGTYKLKIETFKNYIHTSQQNLSELEQIQTLINLDLILFEQIGNPIAINISDFDENGYYYFNDKEKEKISVGHSDYKIHADFNEYEDIGIIQKLEGNHHISNASIYFKDFLLNNDYIQILRKDVNFSFDKFYLMPGKIKIKYDINPTNDVYLTQEELEDGTKIVYFSQSFEWIHSSFIELQQMVIFREDNAYYLPIEITTGNLKIQGIKDNKIVTIDWNSNEEYGYVTEKNLSSSWNDLEDKPFYENITEKVETITWDGVKEGKKYITLRETDSGASYLVKLSDDVPNINDFIGKILITNINGETTSTEITEDLITVEANTYKINNGLVYVCKQADTVFTPGIYFMYESTSSITGYAQSVEYVKYEEQVIKLDPKFLPDNIGGVQSDWLVNDETDPAFVKNRPFYSEVQPVEVVNGTYAFNNRGEDVYISENIYSSIAEFTTGQNAKVIYDNVEYNTCVSVMSLYGGAVELQYIGNAYPLGSAEGIEVEDTGEPFCIMILPNVDGLLGVYAFEEGLEHTISITVNTEVDIQLDRKYIKEIPGLNVEGKVFIIDNEEVTAVKGAEIFNDYEYNKAIAFYTHAEGEGTTASGRAAHAEGVATIASGSQGSHAEGRYTEAIGASSHAEGLETKSSGQASHAEGKSSGSPGNYAHAEGWGTVASGEASHAEGRFNVAAGEFQHVQGKFNISDVDADGKPLNRYAHIVGNGSDSGNKSNAHTLDWQGNAWFAGKVFVGGTSQNDTAAKKLATEDYVNTKVSDLVNSAPETLDTLGELATALEQNSDIVETLNAAIGNKADKADVVQSDWNQNDSTAADYVKNRPFYTETPPQEEYYIENNLTTLTVTTEQATNLFNNYQDYDFYIHGVLGRIYTTSISNNILSIKFYEINGSPNYIYSPIRINLNDNTIKGIEAGNPSGAKEYYPIRIVRKVVDIVHKLDEKFLPEQVIAGRSVKGITYLINDSSVTAQNGAEIFNDYENNIATGEYSHAEGNETLATGISSHAEGGNTIASSSYSHAEGYLTKTSGYTSHAEGYSTIASGYVSHTEGSNTVASGDYSHAEGNNVIASGHSSHAEGGNTTASGDYSHTEGLGVIANTLSLHASGKYNLPENTSEYTFTRTNNIIKGFFTNNSYAVRSKIPTEINAYGNFSYQNDEYISVNNFKVGDVVIDRNECYVLRKFEGNTTVVSNSVRADWLVDQIVVEKTIEIPGKYLHIVGNGESEENRSNAHTLDWKGNTWFAGNISIAGNTISLKDTVNGFDYIIQMQNGQLISYCACTSIEVTTPPNKTEYALCETFDPTGMVITAVCPDGTSREITNYIYATDAIIEAENIVISYIEGEKIYTTTVAVTVVTE